MNDLRYAVRQLFKNPGFTAVAVLSLALGIGAGTVIFSLVNAILLNSLPVPNPQDLRVINWSGADFKSGYDGELRDDGPGRRKGNAFSYSVFLALRQQCSAQADIFGYVPLDGVGARARHDAVSAEGLMVSDNFFFGIGVRPLMGRLLGARDDVGGAAPSVVISFRWWERQFDRDPGVLGHSIMLNGHGFTVVGVSAIPGVRSVALTQYPLLSGGSWVSSFTIPGHPNEGGRESTAHMLTVSETFFTTLGVPVLLGRDLRTGDAGEAPKAVVVNEAFARKFFPGEYPVGQTLKRADDNWQIVGVCRDIKYADIKSEVPPTVYLSFRQKPTVSAFFALRTAFPSLAVATAARKAMAAIDPDIPLTDLSTQEQIRDGAISQQRTFAFLCSSLAVLAVLLSCIGLYGLMAFHVSQRTGEIGVRMALGAQAADVARSILREALVLAGFGIAIGLPAAFAVTRLIHGQLYGVRANDPATFAIGTVTLVAVALGAAWLPARRAARVDPMVALRSE